MGACGSKSNPEAAVAVQKEAAPAPSASVSKTSATNNKEENPQAYEPVNPSEDVAAAPAETKESAQQQQQQDAVSSLSMTPEPDNETAKASSSSFSANKQSQTSTSSASSSAPQLVPPAPAPMTTREETADSQFSTSLRPNHEATYFETQCRLYFEAWTGLKTTTNLKGSNSKRKKAPQSPNLSPDVVRWEWNRETTTGDDTKDNHSANNNNSSSALQGTLTGRDRDTLVAMDIFAAAVAPVQLLDFCFQFASDDQNPFGRTKAQVHNPRTHTTQHLYVEFTFNDEGQILFVESWPLDEGDLKQNNEDWLDLADASNRLSTQIPGLGSPTSVIHMAQLKAICHAQAGSNPSLSVLQKELDRPLKVWFEGALLKRLAGVVPTTEHITVLGTLQQKKKQVEKAGRQRQVELLFPAQDDDTWERKSYNTSLGGAVEFASSAVRTVVFSAQT